MQCDTLPLHEHIVNRPYLFRRSFGVFITNDRDQPNAALFISVMKERLSVMILDTLTRPEQLERPDSGHPRTVQNSPSVQSTRTVQSWTVLPKDAKTPITQFIAHQDISRCRPHIKWQYQKHCFLLIRRSLVRAQVEEPKT